MRDLESETSLTRVARVWQRLPRPAEEPQAAETTRSITDAEHNTDSRNRLRWMCSSKLSKRRKDRDNVQVAMRESRHLTGFDRFRAWNDCRKKRHLECTRTIAATTSLKTISFKSDCSTSGATWSFCCSAIANRIVQTASKNACVAYGDWSSIKTYAVKELKQTRHGRVQDEQALLAALSDAFVGLMPLEHETRVWPWSAIER